MSVDLLLRQEPNTASPLLLLLGEVEDLPDIGASVQGSFKAISASVRVAHRQNVVVQGGFAPMTLRMVCGPEGAITIQGSFKPLNARVEVGDPWPIEVRGSFAPMTMAVGLGPIANAVVAGSFKPLSASVLARYTVDVDRPVVGHVTARHQVACPQSASVQVDHQRARALQHAVDASHRGARPVSAAFEHRDEPMLKLRASAEPTHAEAIRASALVTAYHADMVRAPRVLLASRFQEAIRVSTHVETDYQDRFRDRRPVLASGYEVAVPVSRIWVSRFQRGRALSKRAESRYQEARRPPVGKWTRPVPPTPNPCYTPNTLMVLGSDPVSTLDLLFLCDAHDSETPPVATVVVPVLLEYNVTNDLALIRVADDTNVPINGATLSLDDASWTWGFGGNLPASSRSLVDTGPDADPLDLELRINGVGYRLLSDWDESDRTFANATLKISGRGRAAELADPIAEVKSLRVSGTRTAQQLMQEVLTNNGVPLPWTVDWRLEDWLVPGGVFSHQGTYIEGLQRIVAAAGGYLQPHNTDRTVIALPRYPVAPWDFASATPDFELPSAVVQREGIRRVRKARYNRVFLAATTELGLMGDIKREGTAGDREAPMVTDALFTAIEVLRQRGLAILGDTGGKAFVKLRAPILPATGIIKPGALVRYVDGAPVTGIVRSVEVEVAFPEAWQTLEVETHVG